MPFGGSERKLYFPGRLFTVVSRNVWQREPAAAREVVGKLNELLRSSRLRSQSCVCIVEVEHTVGGVPSYRLRDH